MSAATTLPAFTPPPFLTTSSTPLPTSSGTANLNAPATNGALYLYTFLATLVLLLAVSSAIVARSLVLRRRHQRLVAAAIAAGTWVPPPPGTRPGRFGAGGRGKRVDVGEKPGMLEVWVGSPLREEDYEKVMDMSIDGLPADLEKGEEWASIIPLSATSYSPPNYNPTTSTPKPVDTSPPTTQRQRLTAILPWTHPRSHTSPIPSTTTSPATSNAPSSPADNSPYASTQQVRIAVLIAMPSPPLHQSISSPSPSPFSPPSSPPSSPQPPSSPTPTSPKAYTQSPPSQTLSQTHGAPIVELGVVELVLANVTTPPASGDVSDSDVRVESEKD